MPSFRKPRRRRRLDAQRHEPRRRGAARRGTRPGSRRPEQRFSRSPRAASAGASSGSRSTRPPKSARVLRREDAREALRHRLHRRDPARVAADRLRAARHEPELRARAFGRADQRLSSAERALQDRPGLRLRRRRVRARPHRRRRGKQVDDAVQRRAADRLEELRVVVRLVRIERDRPVGVRAERRAGVGGDDARARLDEARLRAARRRPTCRRARARCPWRPFLPCRSRSWQRRRRRRQSGARGGHSFHSNSCSQPRGSSATGAGAAPRSSGARAGTDTSAARRAGAAGRRRNAFQSTATPCTHSAPRLASSVAWSPRPLRSVGGQSPRRAARNALLPHREQRGARPDLEVTALGRRAGERAHAVGEAHAAAQVLDPVIGVDELVPLPRSGL